MSTKKGKKSSTSKAVQEQQAKRVIFGVIASLVLLTALCIAAFSLLG